VALPKGFSKGRDVHGEVHFLDERIRPNLFEKFILREKPPAVAHKVYQRVENLGSQCYRRAISKNDAFGRPKRKDQTETSPFLSMPLKTLDSPWGT